MGDLILFYSLFFSFLCPSPRPWRMPRGCDLEINKIIDNFFLSIIYKMVYGRGLKRMNNPGRRYRRRYRKYRKQPGIVKMARIAYNGYRVLKSMVNSEKKVFETGLSSVVTSTTGSITSLTDIAQGDDYQNREGRSILMNSLETRLTFTINASATETFVRCLWVLDTMGQDSGSSPPTIAGQILITNAYNTLRSSNPVYMKRFVILKDELLKLDQVNNPTVVCHQFRKMHHHVKYNGTAAADSAEGTIWFVCLSNEATNVPAINGISRIRYYDN